MQMAECSAYIAKGYTLESISATSGCVILISVGGTDKALPAGEKKASAFKQACVRAEAANGFPSLPQ